MKSPRYNISRIDVKMIFSGTGRLLHYFDIILQQNFNVSINNTVPNGAFVIRYKWQINV